jgi:hypothetical protein
VRRTKLEPAFCRRVFILRVDERCVTWFQAVVKEQVQANDDRQVIRQNLTAIAEMARLRAHSLTVLDQSRQLLRVIDDMYGPLIRAPDDGAGRLDTGAAADLRK